MAKLKHIIRYFALNYPYKNELSKARLTKMVYLADWFSVLENSKQISTINWYFDHYGPFVSDVYTAAQKDRSIKVIQGYTPFGTPKETINLSDPEADERDLKINNAFSSSEEEILNKVISETQQLNWPEFIDYVYNTPPIKNERRYKNLNLTNYVR